MRKQIEDDLRANAGKPDLVWALSGIDKKLLAVELWLVKRRSFAILLPLHYPDIRL